MRWLSYGIILLGIVVMAAPKLMEWKADREVNRLLKEAEQMEAAVASDADPQLRDGYRRLSSLFENETHRLEEEGGVSSSAEAQDASAPIVATESEDAPPVPAAAEKPKPQPIATIEIASIGVKLPVLAGATEANMAHAAAHMTETTQIGQAGNAAIAAHRARTKGRLFNRLDEVAEGDEIVIRQAGQQYVYTVFRHVIVEPSDVSVLNKNGDDKMITLITCDPVDTGTHRLIVQARME